MLWPVGSRSALSSPGWPASGLSYCNSRPERPPLSVPTTPSSGRASAPAGRNRLGSGMNDTPSRCRLRTRAATSSGTLRARYTNPALRLRRSRSTPSSTWSTGARSLASSAGSVTRCGLAHTVCWLSVSASSWPLRSNIAPRSAGSTMLRSRCDWPTAAYLLGDRTWIDVRRTTTTVNARHNRTRRPSRRRRGFGVVPRVATRAGGRRAVAGLRPGGRRCAGARRRRSSVFTVARGASRPARQPGLDPGPGRVVLVVRVGCRGLGAHPAGREVGDARGRHHAEALLGRGHDAFGRLELGHLEPAAVVLVPLVRGPLLQAVELELALGQHHVECDQTERACEHGGGGGRGGEPGPAP